MMLTVNNIILQIGISESIPDNEKIADRLLALNSSVIEEESSEISVESLTNFYLFLLANTKSYLGYPAITLTPDNDICASWDKKGKTIISIYFKSNKDRTIVFWGRDGQGYQIN